jgi:hypothetical protein
MWMLQKIRIQRVCGEAAKVWLILILDSDSPTIRCPGWSHQLGSLEESHIFTRHYVGECCLNQCPNWSDIQEYHQCCWRAILRLPAGGLPVTTRNQDPAERWAATRACISGRLVGPPRPMLCCPRTSSSLWVHQCFEGPKIKQHFLMDGERCLSEAFNQTSKALAELPVRLPGILLESPMRW